MATASQHIDRADAYFGDMFGISRDKSSSRSLAVETDRRTRPETGFGDTWSLLALRCGSRCWVSVSPSAAMPLLQRKRRQGSAFDTLFADLSKAKGLFKKAPSLVFLPEVVASDSRPHDGVSLRPVPDSDQVWPGGTGIIPAKSIKGGTAFGVYVGGALVSWAEATPLPATEQFGVMLVGMETHPRHRRKGYAKAALSRLTREVCRRNLTPVFFCGSQNAPSQRTASACGYALYGEWWRFRESDIGETMDEGT